ncbi:hypothetical protein ACFL1Y_01960, partial [Patescibacteria group bacterium]
MYSFLDWTLLPLLRKRINKVQGLENIPKNTNFILATNHIFPGDSMFICAVFILQIKNKIHFITAEHVWRNYEKIGLRKFFGMIPKLEDSPAECLKISEKILNKGGLLG